MTSLRINFNYPTSQLIVANLIFPKIEAAEQAFIKELSFRTRNKARVEENLKKINELKKKWKQHLTERNEEVVEQEAIQIIKGKRPVLKELRCRPNLSNKKSTGYLECHLNGFKYISSRNETV